MAHADRAVAHSLTRTLPLIQDLATDICRDADLLDPDAFEARFESAAAPVENALTWLMADPALAKPDHDTLLDRLRRATTRAASAADYPLRIDLDDRRNPGTRCPSLDPSMLERLVSIAVRHAGPGGHVRITPDAVGRMAVVTVEASAASAEHARRTVPPEMRCTSLQQFAAENACELTWSGADGDLSLRLAGLTD